MENKKLKVAIYCRVANNEPITIEEQEKRLKKYCDVMNYEIIKIYKDIGYSATNTNRPKYQQMLKDLKKEKFEKIIILDFSRLCRSVVEMEKIIVLLRRHNCNLLSLTDNIDLNSPAGIFMARILSMFCEYERRNT